VRNPNLVARSCLCTLDCAGKGNCERTSEIKKIYVDFSEGIAPAHLEKVILYIPLIKCYSYMNYSVCNACASTFCH
jgi:hypothetical protein